MDVDPSLPHDHRAWQSVIDGLDDIVMIVDLEGRIVQVNAATAAYVTRPTEELLGTTLWNLPEIEDVAAVAEGRFSAVARGEMVEPIRLQHARADGHAALVSWSATPLHDSEGRLEHLLLTGRDVTLQHEAEEALRERDAQFRDAFERSDTVWWETDLATGVGIWPDTAEEFYGVKVGDLGPSIDLWRAALHPEDREHDERITQRIIDEGWETFETENRILHPTKGQRTIRTHGRVVRSLDGAPLRLVGIDTDVTERRLAEERLRRSEADFKILADSLPQIVWTAAPDGSVDYYNWRWTEFSGVSQADGHVSGWRPVVHPDDDAATIAAWSEALASGEEYEIEHRIRRYDGSFRWHMSRALPVRDDEGNIVKWFGAATDIHDQKEAALDLQRRAAQQAAVAELGILALRTIDLEVLMDAALTHLSQSLGVEYAKVLRLRDDGGEGDERDLVLEAAVGFPATWVGSASVSASSDSQAGYTLASSAPVVVPDFATERRFGRPAILAECGIASGVSVVIHGIGAAYGVLGVHTTVARSFDDGDVSFVQAVANVLAEAVKRLGVESALGMRVRRLDALHTIDNAITDGTDLHATLRIIVTQIREQLQVDAVAAFVYRDELQTLEYASGVGFLTDAIRRNVPHLGEGFLGTVALEQRIHHVSDVEASADVITRQRLFDSERFVTYFGVPLLVKGALEGVLEIFHRSPLLPDAGWHDFLTTLGTQTAIAINNARLFAHLQTSNTKLRLAYDATIEGWARALELKDHQTEGHSRRVTDVTVRLAIRLGVPDEDLIDIRRGALLHDIGKMGIPDRILLKEGELDAEEWKVMREHPNQAYQLLRSVEFLRGALDIPYAHHERWDGGGYPRGLRGEEIPLAARIFAVADVFDALTSERPYWPAWSTQRAIAYVRDQAGRHFDPAVAAAFEAMMREQDTLSGQPAW